MSLSLFFKTKIIKKDAEASFYQKQLSVNYFLAARLAASAALTSAITVSHRC